MEEKTRHQMETEALRQELSKKNEEIASLKSDIKLKEERQEVVRFSCKNQIDCFEKKEVVHQENGNSGCGNAKILR